MVTIKQIKSHLEELTGYSFNGQKQIRDSLLEIFNADTEGLNEIWHLNFKLKASWVKLACFINSNFICFEHTLNALNPNPCSALTIAYLKLLANTIHNEARRQVSRLKTVSNMQYNALKWLDHVKSFSSCYFASSILGFNTSDFKVMEANIWLANDHLIKHERWIATKWGVNPNFILNYLNTQVKVVAHALLEELESLGINGYGWEPQYDWQRCICEVFHIIRCKSFHRYSHNAYRLGREYIESAERYLEEMERKELSK